MSSVNETPLTFSEWTSYLEKLEEMRKTINDWYIGNSAISTLASEREAYDECFNTCESYDTTCQNNCKDEHLKHQWNLPIFSRETSIAVIGDYFRFTSSGGGGTLDDIAQKCYEEDGVPILPDFDAYKKVIKSSSTPIGFFQEFKEEGSSQTYVGVPKTSQLVKGINNYVILIDKPNTNGCCLMAGVDTTESYKFELGSPDSYLHPAQGNFAWFNSYIWYKAQSVSFPLFRDDTRLDLLSVLPSESQQSTDYTEVRRPMDLVAPIFSIKPAFGAEITKMQNDEANACQKDSIILKNKKVVSGATIFTLRGVAARLGSNWIATIPPDMKFWMWSWHLIELLFKTLVPCYLFEQHGGSSSITTQFCKPIQRRNLQVLENVRHVSAQNITDPDPLAPCAGPCQCVKLFESTRGDCVCDNNDGNLSCSFEPESTECRPITPPSVGSWECSCGHKTQEFVTRICAIDNDQRCTIQSTALWCPKYVTTTNMDNLCNLLKNGKVTTDTFYESYVRQEFDRKETTIDKSQCGDYCVDTGIYEDIYWKYENYETNLTYMNSKIVTRVETPDLFSVISASTLYLNDKGEYSSSDEWAKHMCVGSAMKLIKQAVKVWDCIKEKFIGREQLIDGKKEPELQLGYSCGTMVDWDPTSQVNKPVLPIYKFDIASKQVIDDCSCYGKGSDCTESLLSETSSCNLEDESSVKIVSVYDPSKTNVILKFNFSE